MTKAAPCTVATVNLYHWAEPGIGWYSAEASHSSEGWAEKCAWLTALLAEMDADVVGFQEVVSVAHLEALCAAAGYAHFSVVAEPRFAEAELNAEPAPAVARYYTRPVQAVASRHPMPAQPVRASASVARAAEAPDRPIFGVGDLNDDPSSSALRALTAYRPFERDGGAAGDDADPALVDPAQAFRLIDAHRLSPPSLTSDHRAPTHRSGARGEPIDFVLVSAPLHPWATPQRLVRARVHDAHFRGGDPARSSDHAAVSAQVGVQVVVCA